jgi:hypothetical protein
MSTIFGESITGIYLTGSCVLNGFHEGKSDADCTVLLTCPPNEEQVHQLKLVHRKLSVEWKEIPLECQYVTLDHIQHNETDIQPFYSYYSGALTLGKFNANPVTWFTLGHHGYTVIGKPAAELGITVTADDLKQYVNANVHSYWANYLQRLEKPFTLTRINGLTDQAVEWCVCGISRMYYTMCEGDIASKEQAAEYGLASLPANRHPILKEALHIRNGTENRQYRSRFNRRKEIIAYMKYVIHVMDQT